MNSLQAYLVDKSWFESVFLCVIDIGNEFFSLENVYQYEQVLSKNFPQNNNVKEKIRQTLQYLRNSEILEFVDGKGNYRLLATELIGNSKFDFNDFNIQLKPVPNMPINEIGESVRIKFRTKTNNRTIIRRIRNERIGDLGEKAIITREVSILKLAGRSDLAAKVEQVSKTVGDHAGYDVLSFDKFGKERWIEVKTTTGSQTAKFHISENQISTSEENPDLFELHRPVSYTHLTLPTKA